MLWRKRDYFVAQDTWGNIAVAAFAASWKFEQLIIIKAYGTCGVLKFFRTIK